MMELESETQKSDGKYLDYSRSFNNDKELREFYEKYGFVSIKNLIPQNVLNQVKEDFISIFSPYSDDENNPIDSGIINLDNKDKSLLYEIHMSAAKSVSFKYLSWIFSETLKRISHLNQSVFEIDAGFLLGLPKDKRLVYDFHQESNYMKGFEDIFNIHFPLLRQSNIQNGTMSILPGSHKLGTLEYNKNRVSQNSYTDLIPKNLNSIIEEFPEFHCILELGDVVFFHKDLIHRSNYNSSDLCRPVGVHRLTQSLKGDWVNRRPEEL